MRAFVIPALLLVQYSTVGTVDFVALMSFFEKEPFLLPPPKSPFVLFYSIPTCRTVPLQKELRPHTGEIHTTEADMRLKKDPCVCLITCLVPIMASSSFSSSSNGFFSLKDPFFLQAHGEIRMAMAECGQCTVQHVWTISSLLPSLQREIVFNSLLCF